MNEERFFVTCPGEKPSKDNKHGITYTMYHDSEPEEVSMFRDHSYAGGFTVHLAKAIAYTTFADAAKARNRLQRMYTEFKMSILTRTTKEIFELRLKG